MNIVVYRYGSICEPDMIAGFQRMGLNVIEITEEIREKKITPSRQVELVDKAIRDFSPSFIFSINFFPAVAKVCHIFGLLYLCWTVDSPVLELFSEAVSYNTNRIFLFDRAQYDYFYRFNPEGIFHLPLASAVDRFDQVIGDWMSEKNGTTDYTNHRHEWRFREETKQPVQQKNGSEAAGGNFKGDITFVGSLYSEKSPLSRVKLPDRTAGYIDGICEAALKVFGYNFLEEALSEECIREIKGCFPDFFTLKDNVPELTDAEIDRYVAAHSYVGYLAAEKERIRTLNTLAEHFKVDLFTGSDTSVLKNVTVHGRVNSLAEMPLIFRQSRINLNMTIKPIQTGLPLRIFDILGCGGFLVTNYQEELVDLFEIGVDLEAYGSMEELIDKCAYYLSHEEERARIAMNGYEKVKQFDTYDVRIREMLSAATA